MSIPGKYIYGIINEPQPKQFDLPGVRGAEVYTINHQDIAAVVSDFEATEVDPTRKNVLTHIGVQDMLLWGYTFLPAGFGMLAAGEREVRGLLERNYGGLASELKRLAGKIEAELKVYWDQEAMIRELDGGSQELTRLKAKLGAALSQVERQDLLIKAGQVVEQVAESWKVKYAERVYANLAKMSLEARWNNPVGVTNILNASFLLERSQDGKFKEQVRKLDAEYRGKVNFKYVGPLPPYSFISLRLEAVA